MTALRYFAPMICACGIASVPAAPVPLGNPFHVRHGESVGLAQGVNLKFIDVRDERCPADVTCVWQGEAFVEIELQVNGQTARASITTEKPEAALLAYNVKLLGLYPSPRGSEQRPHKEYVAFLRVADAAPASSTVSANREAALAVASDYVSTYRRGANDVCADWRRRKLTSYIQDAGALCGMMANVSSTAHAFTDDSSNWQFYFLIDDPQMRTQDNESLYLIVAISKAPKNPSDQVRESDVVILPCEATLLDAKRAACNGSAR